MADGISMQQLIATDRTVLRVVASQTTSATGGTQSTHAHGLTNKAGVAITPAFAIPVVTATAVDHASTGLSASPVAVVSIGAVNVTVRCQDTSVTFTLLVG